MKNLANFVLFQIAWFTCVGAAAKGQMWLGPLVVLVAVLLHLLLLARPGERRSELRYILVVGVIGTLVDTGLGMLGATHYPSSESAWTLALVPPWITALWVLFATLPHHSLGWLAGRPWLAAALGGIGGPLSYLGGARMGAVAVGDQPLLTWSALAIEYALLTPLMLHFARR